MQHAVCWWTKTAWLRILRFRFSLVIPNWIIVANASERLENVHRHSVAYGRRYLSDIEQQCCWVRDKSITSAGIDGCCDNKKDKDGNDEDDGTKKSEGCASHLHLCLEARNKWDIKLRHRVIANRASPEYICAVRTHYHCWLQIVNLVLYYCNWHIYHELHQISITMKVGTKYFSPYYIENNERWMSRVDCCSLVDSNCSLIHIEWLHQPIVNNDSKILNIYFLPRLLFLRWLTRNWTKRRIGDVEGAITTEILKKKER